MANDMVYGTIFPLVGTILAWILSLAPISAIRAAEPTGKLGIFNPFPSVIFLVQSCTWFIYGCQKQLSFVILSNGIAILILLYMVLRCYRLASRALRVQLDYVLFSLLSLNMLYVLLLTGIEGSGPVMEQVIGITAVTLNTIMYVVPLSSMVSVVKTKDSSSIYLPWAVGSVLCSTCWAIYGLFGVHDILVALPNVVGVLLGFLQLALRAIYPAHAAVHAASGEECGKEGETAGATVTTSSSSSSSSTTSPVDSISQANPIAMSRKLSMSLGVRGPAAKHLLVRHDSFNELRKAQQNDMAMEMSRTEKAEREGGKEGGRDEKKGVEESTGPSAS